MDRHASLSEISMDEAEDVYGERVGLLQAAHGDADDEHDDAADMGLLGSRMPSRWGDTDEEERLVMKEEGPGQGGRTGFQWHGRWDPDVASAVRVPAEGDGHGSESGAGEDVDAMQGHEGACVWPSDDVKSGRPWSDQAYVFYPAGNQSLRSGDVASSVGRSWRRPVDEDNLSVGLHVVRFLCPCCVGGEPCSLERRESYVGAVTTFCALVSFVQIIMMIVSLIEGGGFVSMQSNPMWGPSRSIIVKLGAKTCPLIRYDNEVWRFFSPLFNHAGIIHLVVNLFIQIRIGLFLESKWGFKLFTFVYLSSGIGGYIMTCIIQVTTVSVGPSCALTGVMAAYLVETLFSWKVTERVCKYTAIVQLVVFTGFMALLGISPLIDSSSHLGGGIIGVIVASGTFAKHSDSLKIRQSLPVVSVLLYVGYFVVLSTFIFTFWPIKHPSH